MSLRIKVMNRENAEKFSHEFHDEPFYMISIHSRASEPPDIDESNPMLKDLLRLTFSDVDVPDTWRSIQPFDGDKIFYFASDIPDGSLVVVHCRAGMSRSAGVAAALATIFNGSDDEFWVYPPYYPNTLVYMTVMESWYKDVLCKETMEKARKVDGEVYRSYYNLTKEDDHD